MTPLAPYKTRSGRTVIQMPFNQNFRTKYHEHPRRFRRRSSASRPSLLGRLTGVLASAAGITAAGKVL